MENLQKMYKHQIRKKIYDDDQEVRRGEAVAGIRRLAEGDMDHGS